MGHTIAPTFFPRTYCLAYGGFCLSAGRRPSCRIEHACNIVAFLERKVPPASFIHSFIYSFIHSFIAAIYILPLQVGLLRSAPNPSAAEKCCFKLIAEEFLGEYSWK